MDKKNKENNTNENDYPVERKRDLVAEKLIMNELLNSEDFEVLLETTLNEFKRTFTITNKKYDKGEIKEIE